MQVTVRRRPSATAALSFVLVAALAGCSNLQQTVDDYLPKREPAYKSSKRLPPLEVPPDLSRSTIGDSMPVPGAGGTTYSEYSGATQQVASARETTGVLPSFSRVRVERSDDKRWLEVEATPAEVWPVVRDFWLEQGFILELEDPSIGIMETDWAEKRANLRSGPIQSLLGRLSTALYGAATRDKFRTRLERGGEPSVTEIFVSHRGAEEVVTQSGGNAVRTGDDNNKAWQPSPSDPELEAEMLNRLMVYFGVSEQQATEALARGPKRPDRASMVRETSGASVLSLQDDFSRAWRRTGLALDRVGFTVEDRDRSRGLYYVRYVDPDQDVGEKKGFFSKLKFWGDDDKPEKTEYLISLIGGEQSTQVIVLNKQGERDTSRTADRILGLLHEQLR